MPRKTGHSRLQYGLFATPLENMIGPDNPVRVIDAFVDSLDLEAMGFRAVRAQARGASSFGPDVLLKIYFYGYQNRIRSSRRLEAECHRNVELMWLTERQTPSYHTISTFRTFQELGLADKGYHSGKGLHDCTENGIMTFVAFPEQSYGDRPKGFHKIDFKYDPQRDEYTCLAGKKLRTKGTWHEKYGRNGRPQSRYKMYRSSFGVCSACQFKDKCLSAANFKQSHGRSLERSEYEDALIANRKRIICHRDRYKRRQAIVEYPFGTIKRSWGCTYTLLKGKEKVGGEMAIFTAYNLRRVMSILGVQGLVKALKEHFFSFLGLRRSVEPVKVGILYGAQERRKPGFAPRALRA